VNDDSPAPGPRELRESLRGHALAGGVTAGFAWLLWMIAGAMEVRLAEIAAIATFVGAVLYGFVAMVFAARLPKPPATSAPRNDDE
jgi:uncharacterized membrane protein YjjB (DUF3815 family)